MKLALLAASLILAAPALAKEHCAVNLRNGAVIRNVDLYGAICVPKDVRLISVGGKPGATISNVHFHTKGIKL